jgi:4-hydroxybenzoate polyprenyltransferase
MSTPDRSTVERARADGRFQNLPEGKVPSMVGILIAAVLAALTFAVCTALGLPAAVGILCSVFVLVASVPTVGNRFGASNL